jgi:hypothetical protein
VPKLTSGVCANADRLKHTEMAAKAFVKNFIVEILYYYSFDLETHGTAF